MEQQITAEQIEKAFPTFKFEEAETNLGILMGKTKGIQAICSKCGMKTIFSASSFEAASYLELHEIKHLLMESA